MLHFFTNSLNQDVCLQTVEYKKANRGELSSQGGENQNRESEDDQRQMSVMRSSYAVVGYTIKMSQVLRLYNTCVYIYSANVFLSNPAGKRRFVERTHLLFRLNGEF